MKRILLALGACLLSSAVLADLRIGVSIAQVNDVFLAAERDYLDQYAKKQQGVSLQFEDAQGDTVRQLNQVQGFVSQGVDAMIINPVDTAATKGITEAATKAGIPLVYINRRPDQATLPAGVGYIGSDEVEAGRLQMQYLADKMGGKGNLAIILGLLSNNATYNRTKGVKEVLAKYPDIKVVAEQNADWERQRGMDLMNNWLTSDKKINAVAANADEMAIGAAMAIKQSGLTPGKDILVGGSDGGPDGLAAIKSGLLAVTAFQDNKGQAEGAVDMAMKMAKKEKVEQEVTIPYRLITPDNLKEFTASK
ncbi:substrate-binding domain-containing protein [Pseudomonas sp. NPDC007930]|uniref:sugar ABC transporter substrate-binding protein n=1 Tax=Pseudomonas sp. NPDC007930 TaxID=3364417 RepID=UPI0036F060CF